MAIAKHDRNVDKFDKYWRFNKIKNMSKEELRLLADNAGYPTQAYTKTALQKYAERVERSLLCYYKCSNEELQQFAQERGIAAPAGAFQRSKFITTLESADQQTTFERFMDLAPELRISVYEYYLAGLPKVLYCPVQPPLSRICRRIRTEIMPMFCNMTLFWLDMSVHGAGQAGKLRFNADESSFLLGLGHSETMRVRGVFLSVESVMVGLPDYRMCLYAGIREDGLSTKVQAGPRADSDSTVVAPLDAATKKRVRRMQKAIDTNASAVLKSVVQRGGKEGLKMRDIYALRSVVEKAWFA
ncbi:hypothetical protein LTR97_004750 [Elasticomyces elasticus]|uniref:Uncharacterized protein n=1 Tax=Elasticomyces elasticus TaxID=574655 RepID=A0AAN7WCB0_9PEZI|nr:hypothetical protein LTR97_004750 [Elasticomyces elasticus]